MQGAYRIITTDAFILHTRSINDADRMLTVLTKQNGVIHLYARSIRKEQAKMRGAAGPYGRVFLSAIQGKRNILKDITVTDPLRTIWRSEKKYTALVRLLRRIYTLIPAVESKDEDLFNLIERATVLLQQSDEADAERILLAAEVLALEHLGYVHDAAMTITQLEAMVDAIRTSKQRERECIQHLENALFNQ